MFVVFSAFLLHPFHSAYLLPVGSSCDLPYYAALCLSFLFPASPLFLLTLSFLVFLSLILSLLYLLASLLSCSLFHYSLPLLFPLPTTLFSFLFYLFFYPILIPSFYPPVHSPTFFFHSFLCVPSDPSFLFSPIPTGFPLLIVSSSPLFSFFSLACLSQSCPPPLFTSQLLPLHFISTSSSPFLILLILFLLLCFLFCISTALWGELLSFPHHTILLPLPSVLPPQCSLLQLSIDRSLLQHKEYNSFFLQRVP